MTKHEKIARVAWAANIASALAGLFLFAATQWPSLLITSGVCLAVAGWIDYTRLRRRR